MERRAVAAHLPHSKSIASQCDHAPRGTRITTVGCGNHRAVLAACVSEAAALQGKYWEMHRLMFRDSRVLEPPKLWRAAERLELDPDPDRLFQAACAHELQRRARPRFRAA